MKVDSFLAKAKSFAFRSIGFALVLTSFSASALAQSCGGGGSGSSSGGTVPEIDPGSMLSALTLLTGGMMMLADRRGRA